MTKESQAKPTTIDEYIRQSPADVRKILEQVRQTIATAVPDAIEAISYGIPTFKLGGKNMIFFGGYPNHIGLYATPVGHKAFEKELSKYHEGKGSVQFPLSEPMPLDLIRRIALYRADILSSEQ